MLNLLIISNNSKAQALRDLLRPLVRARVDLATDFEDGLKAVFEQHPAAVIIQERILDVTGESVARHIQLLLGGNAPGFILLHDQGETVAPVAGLFEHALDLGLPPADLAAGVMGVLERIRGAAELPPQPEAGTPQADGGAPDSTAAGSDESALQPEPVPPPGDFSPAGPTGGEPPLPEEPPGGDTGRAASRPRAGRALAVVALLAAVAGGYLLQERAGSGSPSVGGVAPPVQRAVSSPSRAKAPPEVALPSFVSPAGRDGAYGAGRPGWERYLDDRHDIRLFRQGGRLRALQVVARPGRDIGDDFLKRVLKEVAGSERVTLGSRQQQRRLLLQRGRAGEHADLLVYRSESSRAVVAFVVALD